jgi:hypothetical protein
VQDNFSPIRNNPSYSGRKRLTFFKTGGERAPPQKLPYFYLLFFPKCHLLFHNGKTAHRDIKKPIAGQV